jgi:hypothetical protein
MARVAAPVKNVPFFLKKITPKSVTQAVMLADPKNGIDLLNLSRPVEPRLLYEVYGIIRVATIVPDKSGTKKDSVRFSGKLKAYTPPDENGEQYIFEAGQTYIPVLDEYLYSALKSAQESEPGAYLEAAFSVSIKAADPTKPSMTGYEWDVQKLISQAPSADDPIERLRLEAKAQQLALAAPKKETAENPTNGGGSSGDSSASGLSGSAGTSSTPPVDSAPKHGKNRGSHSEHSKPAA